MRKKLNSLIIQKWTELLGIDCNVDHFALSNVNSKGQLISSWSLKFEILGKTSNQITKIIEIEAD